MAVRTYKITARGPRHYREEIADDNNEPTGVPVGKDQRVWGYNERGFDKKLQNTAMACYAAEGSALEGPFKSIIKLEDDEAVKLKHLGLVLVAAPEVTVSKPTKRSE